MHDTTEEYLESILAIEEEGVVPMRARLVERLNQPAGLAPAGDSVLTRRGRAHAALLLDGTTCDHAFCLAHV